MNGINGDGPGKRVTIVTGHYGSGKSEFSVNLALRYRAELSSGGNGHAPAEDTANEFTVALADVDVVNPYFRSREQRALLESHGIRVVGNQLGIDSGVDLPSVSPEVYSLVRDKYVRLILDTGGDPVGARLLGTVRRLLDPFDSEVLCVVNGSRPETSDAERAIAMIRSIEAAAGLAVTGLVNNTHMLEHTGRDHILEGDRLCREIRERTEIPVRYVGVPRWVELDNDEVAGRMIPIEMYLRESWMVTP